MYFRHISANIQPKNLKKFSVLLFSSTRQYSIGEWGQDALDLASYNCNIQTEIFHLYKVKILNSSIWHSSKSITKNKEN